MKDKIIGFFSLIVLVFFITSGLFEEIANFFVWLVSLNMTQSSISVISEVFVKIATFAISFSLVGTLFNYFKLFNSKAMKLTYFIISTLISFGLCALVMYIEQHIVIIAIIMLLIILVGLSIYIVFAIRNKNNINYYNKHAKEYINNTKDINMKEYYEIFESYLKHNSKILDVGFGSGRDSLYFKNKGYEVVSIDPIIEFCENAKSIGLDNVIQMSIEDIKYDKEFDGIWACASLLHLKSSQLLDVFNKCYKALKDNGVMYVSFKYGDFEGIIDDRYFTYLTEESFTNIINKTNFKIEKLCVTEDKLNRDVKWLNVVVKKDKKKAFEYYILKRFFKTDIGKKYATSNVVFSEHPDFIVNNEKIEIAAVTNSVNRKEYASYEKFVESISSMVKKYFKREISFRFVLRRDMDIKYSEIDKKELSNELICIIKNKFFIINEDGISCIKIYCNDKYKEY